MIPGVVFDPTMDEVVYIVWVEGEPEGKCRRTFEARYQFLEECRWCVRGHCVQWVRVFRGGRVIQHGWQMRWN